MKLVEHFVNYFKEEVGVTDVVVKDYGFYSYTIIGNECLVNDMYIEPQFRGKSFATKMMDEIAVTAKERGCDRLTSNILVFDKNYEKVNKKIGPFLGVGFKIENIGQDAITFEKKI